MPTYDLRLLLRVADNDYFDEVDSRDDLPVLRISYHQSGIFGDIVVDRKSRYTSISISSLRPKRNEGGEETPDVFRNPWDWELLDEHLRRGRKIELIRVARNGNETHEVFKNRS